MNAETGSYILLGLGYFLIIPAAIVIAVITVWMWIK